MTEFTILGKKVTQPVKKLETFPCDPSVTLVRLETEEFTSLCPVTGQPDFSTVIIEYVPDGKCLESKSLKLYLWTFREKGVFCEALAVEIAKDLKEALKPKKIKVEVHQQPHGGIEIVAVSEM